MTQRLVWKSRLLIVFPIKDVSGIWRILKWLTEESGVDGEKVPVSTVCSALCPQSCAAAWTTSSSMATAVQCHLCPA